MLWSAFLACALLLGGCEGAYLAARGGPQVWRDQSNSNQVESGGEAGWVLGAALGRRLAFGGWQLELEGEVVRRRNDVHGRNGGGEHLSADGEEIDVSALMVNAWPAFRLGAGWSLYAGGGLGAARVETFGEADHALAWQFGAGVALDLGLGLAFDAEGWTLDLGWRSFFVDDTTHDGLEARYDSHGPMLGIKLRF